MTMATAVEMAAAVILVAAMAAAILAAAIRVTETAGILSPMAVVMMMMGARCAWLVSALIARGMSAQLGRFQGSSMARRFVYLRLITRMTAQTAGRMTAGTTAQAVAMAAILAGMTAGLAVTLAVVMVVAAITVAALMAVQLGLI
ncbi:hypothetical protein KP814_29540 [Hahella sp. HN01]|nr:hypothetical protein [Hahella sp. HN01]